MRRDCGLKRPSRREIRARVLDGHGGMRFSMLSVGLGEVLRVEFEFVTGGMSYE
jgi:hypothetical protein